MVGQFAPRNGSPRDAGDRQHEDGEAEAEGKSVFHELHRQ
jgi:hypothetical protein